MASTARFSNLPDKSPRLPIDSLWIVTYRFLEFKLFPELANLSSSFFHRFRAPPFDFRRGNSGRLLENRPPFFFISFRFSLPCLRCQFRSCLSLFDFYSDPPFVIISFSLKISSSCVLSSVELRFEYNFPLCHKTANTIFIFPNVTFIFRYNHTRAMLMFTSNYSSVSLGVHLKKKIQVYYE